MDDMPPTTPAHAKDKPRRDALLPVLALILLGGLLEVWASWLQIGAVSGFPHLGRVTTGWILPVTAEAYWGCALWAWLVDPAGKASRMFAMWSAGVVFVLSLAGQESDHLMQFAGRTVPPVGAAMLLTALPLTTIALGAILIHLRQNDREGAVEAVRQDAKDAQIAALKASLDAEREVLRPLREALATAESERDAANAKAESLAAKLAAQKANGRRTKPANGTRRTANGPAKRTASAAANEAANGPANGGAETKVPDDFDARAQALEIYLGNRGISGKELGEAVGLTARWGQLRKAEFAAMAADFEG